MAARSQNDDTGRAGANSARRGSRSAERDSRGSGVNGTATVMPAADPSLLHADARAVARLPIRKRAARSRSLPNCTMDWPDISTCPLKFSNR
jgi:hypothetical protein